MMGHGMMGKYVFIRKSTLALTALAAAGLVGYHFYKHHRGEIKRDVEQLTDDVAEVAKKGVSKAKEVEKEVKS